MSVEPMISAVVLLAGMDAAAVDSLGPAEEILKSFGLGIATMEITAGVPLEAFPSTACAVIIASVDAALPAALAKHTNLPVIRVPTAGGNRSGLTLLDDGSGNLPAGPPDGVFATMAIGEAGARNAALFVISSLARTHERLRIAWNEYRVRQTEAVLRHPPLE